MALEPEASIAARELRGVIKTTLSKKAGSMFILYQVLPYVKLPVIWLIQNTQELTDLDVTLKHVH